METPTQQKITLGSESKHFDLDGGRSDGSSISVTFSIPPEMSSKDLARWTFEEKEKLDLFVLSAEYLKGSLKQPAYVARKASIKAQYDQLLHRQPAPTEEFKEEE